MIRLIAVAAIALAVSTSAQAMPRAPHHQHEGMVTQIAQGCGIGRIRVNGVCVTRGGYYGYRRHPYAYYGYGGYRRYGYFGHRPYVRGRVYRPMY